MRYWDNREWLVGRNLEAFFDQFHVTLCSFIEETDAKSQITA
jgi:hypothetical protein